MLPDRDYPEDPYPGAVPACSFVHLDELSHPIHPDRTASAGWRLGIPARPGVPTPVGDRPTAGRPGGPDLDDWLAQYDAAPLAGRLPVLVYGSNRCPSKITWLRRRFGLAGPVVVVRVQTRDVAAVWASGRRLRDGQRPAVLAAAPGVTESHAVWFATGDQVEVLDRCEGRDDRYRLARLPVSVRGEDGGLIDGPWCYLALGAIRRPLLVDGTGPVRCADLSQERAALLVGHPAEDDGLAAATVRGAPHPDEWPGALFSYGLLRPGQSGWPLVAPHAAGPPRPARANGSVYDTGLGWPALLLDGPGEVSGAVVPLRDPVTLLAGLDDYEGPDYRRVRLVLGDGTTAWAYVWTGDRTILR